MSCLFRPLAQYLGSRGFEPDITYVAKTFCFHYLLHDVSCAAPGIYVLLPSDSTLLWRYVSNAISLSLSWPCNIYFLLTYNSTSLVTLRCAKTLYSTLHVWFVTFLFMFSFVCLMIVLNYPALLISFSKGF